MNLRITNLFFFLLLTVTLFAQQTTTLKAFTDKRRILIGEPLQLTIEVKVPDTEPIRTIVPDTIAHFEWIGKPVTDTLNTENSTSIRAVYTITSFDSGQWVIPSFELSGGLKTDTIPVDVVFSDFNPQQPYHDIKDIQEAVPENKQENGWWWYAGVCAFFLLLLLIYFLRKKKPVEPPALTVAAIQPFDEAMMALKQLQEQQISAKYFHERLSSIFRLYVFKKKNILSLQKTTDDLILQLSDTAIEKSVFDEMAQALRLGDFVKFAKYEPAAADNLTALACIRKTIESIEQLN